MRLSPYTKLALLPLALMVLPLLFRHKYPVVAPENALVLVTGTSSGLGREAVRELHRQGYAVLATVRKEEDVKSLEAEFGAGSRIRAVRMDITNAKDRARVVRTFMDTAAALGVQPYGLVNNAGGTIPGLTFQATEESLEWNHELLVEAPVLLTNAIYPILKNHGAGRILFIGSTGSGLPMQFMGLYTMYKAALQNFAVTMRNEVARSGVAVTAVLQGPAVSQFFDKNIGTKYHQENCVLQTPDAADAAFYCAAAAKFFGDFEGMPQEGELGHGAVAPGFQVEAWVSHLGTAFPGMYLYTNFAGRAMVFVSGLPGWLQEALLFM